MDGSVGSPNDWRRARTTWIASPAAIASLATSTAWMYSSRPRLVSTASTGRESAVCVARARRRTGHLGLARTRRPLERLEDRGLGDAVSGLEVRRLGVERGDRRQRMRQVVEHEHEVGLDERRGRDADGVALGEWHGRLEGGHSVVRERPDGTAGEPRHPLGRLDATTRDEGSDGGQRVGTVERLDGQARRVDGFGHRSGLDASDAVAHLEQPPGTDAKERIAPQPLPALDGFEKVRRATVIEPEEGADRRLEVRRTRRAQEDRVRVGGDSLRLRQADRVRCGHRDGASRIKKRPFRPGTKGRAFRGATLIRRCRTSRDRRAGRGFRGDRSALPCIAGALRRSLLTSAAHAAPCSVRRLPGPFPRRRRSGSHQPPDLWIDSDGYSSRSSPVSSSMSAESRHAPVEASSRVGVGMPDRLVSKAAHHRQRRVAREGRIDR